MTDSNLSPKASAILSLLRERAQKEATLFHAGGEPGTHIRALSELKAAGYVIQDRRERYGERTYTLVGDVSMEAAAAAVANARGSRA